MAARFRVALHGFSDFERTALSFCLKHAGERVPAYVQVERIADCDFIVADASHPVIDGSIVRGERLRDTLFVGDKPPPRAVGHVARPLDPERILRALDHMVLQRLAPRRPAEAPDVVLPMAAPELSFPLLDRRDIVEETTPAAFQHEPLDIPLKDARELDAAAAAAQDSTSPAPPTPLPADELAPVRAAAPQRPAPVQPRAPAESAAGPAPMTEDERRAAKAAARRKSRAARLAQARKEGKVLEDVLLLDGNSAPDPIAALLEAFGFCVQRMTDVDAAMGVLESTPLAAAFLDLTVVDEDGIDGIALCQMIKQGRMALAGDVPPVMLIARRKVASESVRAKLAGCDAYLAQPVKRGDVARVLEACDVAFPADQRRSPR